MVCRSCSSWYAFSSLAACSSFISRMRSVAVAAPGSSLSARAFCGVGEVAVAGAFYELQAAHLRKIGTRQFIAFFQRQRLCLPEGAQCREERDQNGFFH